jgi:hypothetical protein
MANIELGNLYEFNKNAMSQIEPMDMIAFNRLTDSISRIMMDSCEEEDLHYWMLLCHDRRDYTLFNIVAASDVKYIANELKPTLLNRGSILDIELQNNGAYEIWIRDNETKENFAYYLFSYDTGVIEVNE